MADLFFLLSSEAFRLTIGDKTKISVFVGNQKRSGGLSARAAGSLARAVAAIGLT
ncbi:hypothetical protein [Mucilaginibacter sp.]|uniref:hypothetical protein n=1 Tax=Mucilaginibacter sp. TaxID=1882438 RepID=UPI00260252C6|nr:hypothetical protein [Mucilaginibacter sp.]